MAEQPRVDAVVYMANKHPQLWAEPGVAVSMRGAVTAAAPQNACCDPDYARCRGQLVEGDPSELMPATVERALVEQLATLCAARDDEERAIKAAEARVLALTSAIRDAIEHSSVGETLVAHQRAHLLAAPLTLDEPKLWRRADGDVCAEGWRLENGRVLVRAFSPERVGEVTRWEDVRAFIAAPAE
jgi:hypothetical protein